MILETRSDDALLELADYVLQDAGFDLSYSRSDDELPILLIENSDAVAAVGAFLTVADLLDAEGGVSRTLSKVIAAADASSKRWDGYVVLLTSSHGTAEDSEPLSLLTQNLRHVRRIVRVAVDPTRAGVARALRPLLPLGTNRSSDWMADPLDAMSQLLERDGFATDEIQGALQSFRLTRTDYSGADAEPSLEDENNGG